MPIALQQSAYQYAQQYSYQPGNTGFDVAREAETCRRSLSQFVQHAWKHIDPAPYIHNWHIDCISEHLQAVTKKQIRKLIINCPPGVAKSTIVSVMWPAWEWIDHPGEQSLFGSYDENLALRDSVKCRRVVECPWYTSTFRPKWFFSKDQKAKGYYTNTFGGSRYTFGMKSGGKTGWRANKVVLDDPNSVMDQYNASVKAAAYDIFGQVLSTRVNDVSTSAFVIIQQRMSTDDMSGLFIREDSGWVLLKLPMIATNKPCTTFLWTDPRKPGELLFEKKFPMHILENKRKFELGEHGWAGQMQQEPTPVGGSRFKSEYFQHWYSGGYGIAVLHKRGGIRETINLNLCWIFVTCDFAASEKQQADWTVFSIWAVTKDMNLLLLDRRRGQWNEPKIIENAVEVYNFNGYNNTRPICFVAEDNGLGLPIRQAIQAQGIPVLPVFIHAHDKFVRSATAAVRLEAGQIFWPDPRTPWYSAPDDGWEIEHIRFPAHDHDDQVDTTSLAAEALYVAQVITIADGVTEKKSENQQEKPIGLDRHDPENKRREEKYNQVARKMFGRR